MNRQTRSVMREVFAFACALIISLGLITWAPAARAQEGSGSETTVTGAEFRWGVNSESGTKGHAPGTFNFLYAGDVSRHINGPNTAIPASAWSSKSGDVTIQKRSAGGVLGTASWADTQTDRSGTALKAGAHSGLEMLFSNGEGTVDADAGTANISWDGIASIVYYSGFVYMTVSDPELVVTKSSATITAELGGHKTDREDSSLWEKITPRRVAIAELPRDCVELGGDKGFAVSPEYLGVKYADPTNSAPQKQNGDNWGSFPPEFVDFANDTGSGQFWYSSGGTADALKIALPVSVGWDPGNSDDLAEVCDSPTSGGSTKGIVGQVIDDTIENIIRSAGTDVSDTAAAWMDEAWKPAQPDAVKAAQSAQAGGGTVSAPSGGADAAAGEAVVDAEFSAQFEEQYGAGTQVTAGTVGGTVATAPASSGGVSRGGAAAAPTPAPAAGVSTMPVAANLPLTEVVYSQSASASDTGSSFQWQWLVGLALLVVSGGLGYILFLRKS